MDFHPPKKSRVLDFIGERMGHDHLRVPAPLRAFFLFQPPIGAAGNFQPKVVGDGGITLAMFWIIIKRRATSREKTHSRQDADSQRIEDCNF